ncbi:hypothetical protein TNCV_3554581 [Trichonephila clavipes]|nr:hypothetical protein TNCV_3554581 [Trichonephila clavipes]
MRSRGKSSAGLPRWWATPLKTRRLVTRRGVPQPSPVMQALKIPAVCHSAAIYCSLTPAVSFFRWNFASCAHCYVFGMAQEYPSLQNPPHISVWILSPDRIKEHQDFYPVAPGLELTARRPRVRAHDHSALHPVPLKTHHVQELMLTKFVERTSSGEWNSGEWNSGEWNSI